MVETVESALEHHRQPQHDRGNTTRPTRQLMKRLSSGQVPVVSSGNKRATVVVAPLASTQTHPAATPTAESNSNRKDQPTKAIRNENTTSRKAPTLSPTCVASVATAQPPGVSRTQQKLLLQRQQCLVEDETTMIQPTNMRMFTHELDRVGREYGCVKKFQDPMRLSLERCILLQQGQRQPVPDATGVHRHHQALKVQKQQKNKLHTLDNEERRNMKRSSSAAATAVSSHPLIRWSAGAFLDRVLWNGSNSQ